MESSPREFLDAMRGVLDHPHVRDGKQGYYAFLAESDALLKATIDYWRSGQRPQVDSDEGSVEFGILPYWAEHPSKELPESWREFLQKLVEYGLIPRPTVTPGDYALLLERVDAGTAVAGDGTLWGTGPYQQLNWRWVYAAVNDLVTRVEGKATFGNHPFVGTMKASTTIALVGDWGTGDACDGDPLPAAKVMNAAQALHPDYLIHLGDVYYTGQPHGLDLYQPPLGNTEQLNLLDAWPTRTPNTSFTLNSNHEMYCGGKGLFDVAYAHPPFEHQNRTSYFLLQNDHFQLFGLDSAYWATSTFCMQGALDPTQQQFLQGLADPSKQSILLTHHTGLNEDGTKAQGLWADVEKGLAGRQPDYWYWGHIHNGIAYRGVGREPEARNHTVARCVGHGAIPYGYAWSLTKPGSKEAEPPDYIDSVEFFAHEKATDPARKGQVKNGFLLLTLEGSSLGEAFYDEDGRQVWPPPSPGGS